MYQAPTPAVIPRMISTTISAYLALKMKLLKAPLKNLVVIRPSSTTTLASLGGSWSPLLAAASFALLFLQREQHFL